MDSISFEGHLILSFSPRSSFENPHHPPEQSQSFHLPPRDQSGR